MSHILTSKDVVKRKIKVLQKIKRESYLTGEMMGWEPGDIEDGYIDLKTMQIEINWG